MNPIRKVKLWGGPLDGYLYGVEEVNGKLPRSVDLLAPSPVPSFFIPDDGPFPEDTDNRIVTYERSNHPSHGLTPVYRFVK